jgi:hypothetical protein
MRVHALQGQLLYPVELRMQSQILYKKQPEITRYFYRLLYRFANHSHFAVRRKKLAHHNKLF